MSDKIEYSRLLMKRTTTAGETPTVPPITAVTLNQFTPTDLFVGEFFLNAVDDLLWIRTENNILPISLSGITGTTVTPTLDQVLLEGNNTNGLDINVSAGDTIQFQGLDDATNADMIGIDSSGNVVSLSGLTYNNVASSDFRLTAGFETNSLPRFSVISPAYDGKGQFGIQFGNRSYTDTTNPAYGSTGDSFIYAGGLTNNLNIINAPGTGDTTDSIRVYAGSRPTTSVANVYIQGSGSTKGYVGINKETPTERLDVNGNIKASGNLIIGTVGTSTPVYNLAVDSNGVVVIGGSGGGGGTSGTSGTSGVNGTQGASGSSGTSGVNGISAGRTYYFNQSQNSDLSGFKVLSDEPTTATTQTVSVNVPGSTNDYYIQRYITDELGFNVIPSGVQRFYLQFTKPAENDDISAYVVLQITNSTGGTIGDAIVSSTESIGWNGGLPYELGIDVVLPTTSILPTYRISVTIFVNNGDGATRNVTYSTENGNYSFVITSVGVVAGTSGTSGSNGTSGTSGTSSSGGGAGGTHFGTNLAPNWSYNLSQTTNLGEMTLGCLANSIIAFPITPSRNVSIQGLTMMYYRPNGATGKVKYLIYDNNDALLLPNNKLVESPALDLGFFAKVQYNTTFTFNAGTTYWVAIAFDANMTGGDGEATCKSNLSNGMLTFAAPNVADGYGLVYKSAVSQSSFSSIPSVWVPAPPQYFCGSDYLLEKGYYGAVTKNQFPSIEIITAGA